MCFQRSSERIEGKSRPPQSEWKVVPHSRTGCREPPIAKFVASALAMSMSDSDAHDIHNVDQFPPLKNFENPLRFDTITVTIGWRIFWDTVYNVLTPTFSILNLWFPPTSALNNGASLMTAKIGSIIRIILKTVQDTT